MSRPYEAELKRRAKEAKARVAAEQAAATETTPDALNALESPAIGPQTATIAPAQVEVVSTPSAATKTAAKGSN